MNAITRKIGIPAGTSAERIFEAVHRDGTSLAALNAGFSILEGKSAQEVAQDAVVGYAFGGLLGGITQSYSEAKFRFSGRGFTMGPKSGDDIQNVIRQMRKDGWVEIAPGATILPGTVLRGGTTIGAGAKIGPNTLLENVQVGENATVNASQGYDSTIGKGAKIGPFCHIRPDSHIGENVKIGDFVEVKNSTIGTGTSLAHLTYIGDSDVGAHCNFGCGVVTVNYDGENKSRTTVGDYVFVGCNANLIAPVTLEDGAYIAAGSTITESVPAKALAIARARQTTKPEWAAKKLAKYIEKHKK